MPEGMQHSNRETKERQRKYHHRKGHKEKVASSKVVAVAAEEETVEDWDANRERVERLCQIYPNNICNDCNNNGTRWASVNHGVFLCIRCSGIHRSLGVHISRIKSTNMDKWHASEVAMMEVIGNERGKSLYEARLPKGMKSMTGAEPELTLRTFITQKYQEKAFAVENVKEVLHQCHKQTRYGRRPRKSDTKAHIHGSELDTAAKGGNASQREDTMKALYGVNAEAISKKSKKARPLHGTFGVVNVPPDEYEERRRELLTYFCVAEPPPSPVAAAAAAAA
ncbi:ADP-ribosylation factor GTPase activating protein [Trypanosoma rangeli]|uniref:ADP-ribosylation factor GTPase activating protein n=1 Tax=Trypanosoma rangeli TaxID=5698 RepID=A0A422N066_TRYRA|nr:ADP-ribosylation factor GTPase activating protein [Trypanosoma rangeli]RNE98853.1 ADP-ribosylation factor GTPase activating protein [Trypanosoma rangeli]|eukprot:RNE98853.1 ADP-ribosylation factor GTPase activating protein [Trypanosoma rangeli]